MMLRYDPFREFDRLFEAAASQSSTAPRQMPMNAVRRGDTLHVSFDLPGFSADSIDLTVERNQLTLTAERANDRSEGDEWLVAERPAGRFTRQLLLGENLDTERIDAQYHDGVLEVTIPVAQEAKARKVSIGGRADEAKPIDATSSARDADAEHAVSA